MGVINTNMMSLSTQLNLNKSKGSLATSIERLSSGLRINSAKDDAAGQSIANRFTANINGLQQAARNANDGISLSQTAEGALNEINDNLQRIRQLSVQAANGSNAALDLNSIQKEISQRMDEVSRIGAQTQFNGKKILSQDATFDFQVGAFDNETVSIKMTEMSATRLSVFGYNVNGTDGATTAVAAGDLTRFVPNLTGDDTVIVATAADLGKQLGLADDTAVKISAAPAVVKDSKGNLFVEVDIDTTKMTAKEKDALAAQGVDITGTKAYIAATSSMFSDVDPNDATQGVNVSLAGVTSSASLVGEKTTDPLAALDSAMAIVDDLRSTFGAIQNRFTSIISNLNNTTNNLSAARSRIEDADMAVEVSNMSRAQILQQAGTSVLSQANQVPQTVLSLLR